MNKILAKELRTGKDISKLLNAFDKQLITIQELSTVIFLGLARARSEGHTDGWTSAQKIFYKQKFIDKKRNPKKIG